jgi:hypothetical protein
MGATERGAPRARGGDLWIKFNTVLFSAYASFGVISLFWPSVIDSIWLVFLHLATLAVNLLIVYGLSRRALRINWLVAVVSLLMIANLLIFTLNPLNVQLAYLGPSRSFYSAFLSLVSLLGGGRLILAAFVGFNVAMAAVHVANLFYFTRKRTAEMFKGGLP